MSVFRQPTPEEINAIVSYHANNASCLSAEFKLVASRISQTTIIVIPDYNGKKLYLILWGDEFIITCLKEKDDRISYVSEMYD